MKIQKYKIHNINIPQKKRQEINQKCLYVIENNLNQLTQQDIFLGYSGQGGLHGLKYNDFNNFYEYTESKKAIEMGAFFTPAYIAQFIVNCIQPSPQDIVMDLTSGAGVFFNFCPIEEHCYSNELNISNYKVQQHLYPQVNITNEDIRNYNPEITADIIFGNPPFNLKWLVDRKEIISQLYYFIKSYELLKPGGILALITPESFLKDEFINKNMISQINEMFNFICQLTLPLNVFETVGVDTFETKIMILQKKSKHITKVNYNNQHINIPEISQTQAHNIHNIYVKPLIEEKNKIKSKLFLENLHNNNSIETQEFAFKTKKLLYDIKRHPKTCLKYIKCIEYVNKFYTQQQPEHVDKQEWDKIKITKNKVLSYLNKTLQKQNSNEKHIIKLVKTKYNLKLKAYSPKTKLQLSKMDITKQQSINSIIFNTQYPFKDITYQKLINKKRKIHNQQIKPYIQIKPKLKITNFLNNLIINDQLNNKKIRLNTIQKEDINKTLQKNYAFLQWERGCGKTIAGVAQGLYRLENNNINNVIVIAPAIAIKGTWEESLKSFNIPYISINKLDDLSKIKKEQFVLMTLHIVKKYKKQIKKMLKTNNKKYMLVFDESDTITNINSQTYKSVLDCFRRLVKYKLLLTGTATRNNINEFFSQLELLYNNSSYMLSTVKQIYKENKITNTLQELPNTAYMQPIRAYKKGYNLFKMMFSPSKITVFGINQYNQDIYNSAELKKLMNYTVITRTFKEVTGRDGYKIHQKLCDFNMHERNLYTIIINEFHTIEREYYNSTGNSRKDAMLKALHQLNLLLQACSRFHTFKQYTGSNISTKFINIIHDLKKLHNNQVAIGCITKQSVKEYQQQIQKHFPNRTIIVFTGENTNIYQRKKIIQELKQYDNAILITTQQSLSCSLNIGFIDHIMIPELQFNDAKMGQYYFRFIRYDSTRDKNVYIYTYKNSIESNLIQLIMSKEKINLFMKNQELDIEDINEKYGINFNIFNMLLKKEKNAEGNLCIKWGEQKIK